MKSLSLGGYFRVEENYLLPFDGQRYQVTADGSGRLTRTYFDHDPVKPLDSQGQAWLMGIMPEVIRKSGLGAVPRLQRILRQGGPTHTCAGPCRKCWIPSSPMANTDVL